MRKLLPPPLEAWQAKYGIAVASCGIRRMTTRWGTCNVAARRVWFNIEQVKKPTRRIENVAHELAHPVEHNPPAPPHYSTVTSPAGGRFATK